MDPLYRPQGVEQRWQQHLGGGGPLRAPTPRPARETVRDRRPAAERHGRAPHGARAERLDPGRARSAGTGCRASTRSGSRATTTRASRRRAWWKRSFASEGTIASGDRPRGVRRARVGVAARVRRHDHEPVPPARLLARLRARTVHDGRRLRARGDAVLRPPLRARLDLPRQPHHQLVQRLPDVDLRSRGRAHRGGRRAHVRAVSARRRQRPHHDRDGAAGDDPRRRRRRGAPGRRALPRSRRQGGDRARSSSGACR